MYIKCVCVLERILKIHSSFLLNLKVLKKLNNELCYFLHSACFKRLRHFYFQSVVRNDDMFILKFSVFIHHSVHFTSDTCLI
jgi:hypothetical protein